MRTTLNLRDQLIEEAMRRTGITEKTALIHKGLETLIELSAAHELAALGGTMPQLRLPGRRRTTARRKPKA